MDSLFNNLINFISKFTFLKKINKEKRKRIYFFLLYIFSFPSYILTPFIASFNFIFKTGFFYSWIYKESLDNNKKPLPWISYSAIDYLSKLDLSKFNIFEYGSGNSTIWYLDKFKKIYSVENNDQYRKNLIFKISKIQQKEKNEKSLAPFEIFYENDVSKYNNYINNFSFSFDVIMIDGAFEREECVDQVIKHVKQFSNKLIILDNADIFSKAAKKIVNELDYFRICFFSPCNNMTRNNLTSFFFNKKYLNEITYK
jgi:hypothetical protein